MKAFLLSVSLLCVLFVDVQLASARDVHSRSRPDDATDTFSFSKGTSNSKSNTQRPTEERLQRLERILDSQSLVDMLVKIENLQSELQILRGELEIHTHQLGEIKQRQRDLYIDVDRRILSLERDKSASGTAPGRFGSSGSNSLGSNTIETNPATSGLKPGTTAGIKPSTATKPKPASNPQPSAIKPAGAASTAKVDFAAEQKAYQSAFDLLRELRYEPAVSAFKQFIVKFPQGRYAHIAQYWIGEANYAQRNFKQAITDYQKLIDNYPNSPKLAEALLKIGYSQYELKRHKQAETTLKRLMKNYPGTTEAGQAQNLIQKIRLKR